MNSEFHTPWREGPPTHHAWNPQIKMKFFTGFGSFGKLLFSFILPLFLAMLSAAPVFSQATTGWVSPTQVSDIGVGSEANAYVSDNSRAIFGDDGDYANYYTFNLSIPAGRTISGIEVLLEGYKQSSLTTRQFDISLSGDGGASWTAIKTQGVGTIEEHYTLGGSADLWGGTWGSVNFSNSNFYVKVAADNSTGNIYLDHIQVRVHYVATVTTLTFNSTSTFTAPPGVTSITVQAWGGGGGTRSDNGNARGGGGGGAYAQATFDVTPGQTYNVVVGAGGGVSETESVRLGGDSYFGTGTNVRAKGGIGGNNDGGNGGSRVTSVAIGTNVARFAGGNGGNRNDGDAGGGGGGSAFLYTNGSNGVNGGSDDGGAGGLGTGNGGKGGDDVDGNRDGQNGNTPGGGGGGHADGSSVGGSGAAGRLIITYEVTCTTPPNAGTINSTNGNAICVDGATTLSSDGDAGAWTSSSDAIATVSSSGVVTGVSAGNVTLTYTVTGTGGCTNATATYDITVTAKPNAGVISSTNGNAICVDGTTTLSSDGDAGAWTSSSNAIATVSSIGVVTGVTAGNVTITYTVTGTGGCSDATATYDITVTAKPNAGVISSTNGNAICVDGTTTLSSDGDAGAWTSSSDAIATVSSSGVVTGITAGNVTITYTVTGTGGCSDATATYDITVTAKPNAGEISSTNGDVICVDGTTTLSSDGDAGSWSSSSNAIATVSSSGVVTGISAGNVTITYTVTGTGGCSDATATYDITVKAKPNAGVISSTNGNAICVDGTTTLSSNGDAGSWTSSGDAIATVSSSGVVTGITAGNVTITYTVSGSGAIAGKPAIAFTVIGTGACSDATATYDITVTAKPNAGVISSTNGNAICVDGTTTLSTDGDAGSWSSSAPSVASVDFSSGLVTGLTAGSATITYTVTGSGGCSDAMVTYDITVTAKPNAGVISSTNGNTICVDGTTTLSSDGDAGAWTSSSNAIATVSSAGVVTGVTAGNVTITYTVTGTGGCSDVTATYDITVNAKPNQPGTMSGSANPCETSTQVYSIAAVTGATGYTWTVPAGWTITNGQGSVSITVTVGATSGNVTVTADNACGSSIARSKTVTVRPATSITKIEIDGIETLSKEIVYGCAAPELKVFATGTGFPIIGLKYQWYIGSNNNFSNASPILLANNATYKTDPGKDVGTYYYFVKVMGACTDAVSGPIEIRIIPQPADGTPDGKVYYTGPDLAWTPTSTSNTATVTLSAFLKNSPEPGAECGNISTARVTFEYRTGSTGTAADWTPIPSAQNLPVNFVDPNNPSLGGTASAIVQLSISGSASSEIYDIRVRIHGNYTVNYSDVSYVTQLLIGKLIPGGAIGGSAWLCNTASTGFVKGAVVPLFPNLLRTKATFGVEYVVKGTKVQSPKGRVTLMIPSYNDKYGNNDFPKVHWYYVKSNAIAALGITRPTATFTAKANISEWNPITDMLTPIEGNLTMVLDMGDYSPAKKDQVGVVVYRNAGGIWYSNNFQSGKTVPANICGGDLTVSGLVAPTATTSISSSVLTNEISGRMIDEARTLGIKAFPNPSANVFNIRIESDNTAGPVRMRVFDISGRVIESFEKVNSGTLITLGEKYRNGTYIVEVTQGNQVKNIKVIKL